MSESFTGPILVTGVSGYLGEHLARYLARSFSHAIIAGTTHSKDVAVDGVKIIKLDLASGSDVKKLLEQIQPTHVIHTAALTDVAACQLDPERARRSIEFATENLVEGLEALALKTHLTHVSTDLVYAGEQSCERKVHVETDEASPISTYGVCKLRAEEIVGTYPHHAIARPSLIFGAPSTHKGSFLGWLTGALERGEKVSLFVDEFRSPIAVDDLALALTELSLRRAHGLWLAGGSEVASRFALGEMICEELNFSKELLVPTRLADSTYPAPRPAELGLDSSKLWSYLGRRPMTFREALRRLARNV